jgi:hypothetical protein
MKHPTLSAEEREVIRDWLTKPKDSAEYRTAMRRVWNLLPPETSRPTEFVTVHSLGAQRPEKLIEIN